MTYQKPEVEIVLFDFEGFMTGSLMGGLCAGYTDSVGHNCGTYTVGSSCTSWTTPSFGGATCASYNGRICKGYTDNSHNPCTSYGTSCKVF